ncbi:MAG: FAD-dependent oxidoreductase [Clostridia bacterium]|nr:FAD-dependent oxidoreductase [Clostridia bacterium]
MIVINNIKKPIHITDGEIISDIRKKYNYSGIEKIFIKKKSLDARGKNFSYVYSVGIILDDEKGFLKKYSSKDIVLAENKKRKLVFGNASLKVRPVVVGFGPAGIFCAYELAKNGYKPLIIERGGKVSERDEAVNNFWQKGILNPESNVQFGEGGAGTYSDGKLTTRIGDHLCSYVIETFHFFGGPEEILYKSKPHIGTDLLKEIVVNMRNYIISKGGEFLFDTKLIDIDIKDKKINKIKTSKGDFETELLILATGHSARDIYKNLYDKKISMIGKTFSVGFRIEHLQEDVDKSLYGDMAGNINLPKGEYQLSYRENGKGVYTFCMCPGGTVVAAASEENTVVVNGMSNFARDGKNANCAVVANVDPSDFGKNPLDGVEFQRMLEKKAFQAGGGDYSAPCQLTGDFLNGVCSSKFGTVKPTYTGNTKFYDFNNFFSSDIASMLKKGIVDFSRKMKCFGYPDGVLTGVETRTSAPVRILRNEDMESDDALGLYPCGEGAGYAGGIVSAAVDGIKVAEKIISKYSNKDL